MTDKERIAALIELAKEMQKERLASLIELAKGMQKDMCNEVCLRIFESPEYHTRTCFEYKLRLNELTKEN